MKRFLFIIATIFNGAVALLFILGLKKRFSASFDPLLDTSFFQNPVFLVSGIVVFLVAAIAPHVLFRKGRNLLANLLAYVPGAALIALVVLVLAIGL